MRSLLIKDTTKEEREKIVRESLAWGDIGCDDAIDGYDFYEPYIEGKVELKELTMAFRTGYVKNMGMPDRGGCGYMG